MYNTIGTWGVPIPALHCQCCGHAELVANMVDEVADGVQKDGLDFWDDVDLSRLKTLSTFQCPTCGNADLHRFSKEYDILDVWFGKSFLPFYLFSQCLSYLIWLLDSGVSNFSVLQRGSNEKGDGKAMTCKYPCDLYLEGRDQHRGWFQSSMLCSMVLSDTKCADTILTHCFVGKFSFLVLVFSFLFFFSLS